MSAGGRVAPRPVQLLPWSMAQAGSADCSADSATRRASRRRVTELCTNRCRARPGRCPLPELERQQLREARICREHADVARSPNLCVHRLDWPLGPCRTMGSGLHAVCGRPRLLEDAASAGVCCDFERWSILIDEGFQIRRRKPRSSLSERQKVGGLVLNAQAQCSEAEYDDLRADALQLHSARPDAEKSWWTPPLSRPSPGPHRLDRIVLHRRGRKLRALFDQIPWPAEARWTDEGGNLSIALRPRILTGTRMAIRVWSSARRVPRAELRDRVPRTRSRQPPRGPAARNRAKSGRDGRFRRSRSPGPSASPR